MSARNSFYITTPIYYVNDLPHIGHTYTTVVADALARFHRLCGHEVYFLTGTDEHGQKIQRAAAARGITPLELADEVVANYRQLWPALSISNDDFIRTTEERHRRGVYRLFARIAETTPGAVYKGSYRGLYCTGCEAFYTKAQLNDGKCPDQGHPVEEVEEESWFFRLSAFEDKLLELYASHPGFVQPESRLNEVRAFVASGLKDLSISRSKEKVSWGIPFPGDPEHVVYVWFDALTNYISALGFGDPEGASLYERLWHGDAGHESIHLVGKDILRFHAVYWPAFLMAAGEPLPGCVFGHGWWLKDDQKMSKTVGNVARPLPLIDDFGADGLRWFLLREVALGADGSFSEEAVLERFNADLANNIGNLYARVVALVEKGEGGVVPTGDPLKDDTLEEVAAASRAAYRAGFERRDPSAALRALTEWADALNKFLVRHEPWRRAGREAEATAALTACCAHLAELALRLWPAMPVAAARFWRMLGLGADPAQSVAGGTDLLAAAPCFAAGARVAPGDIVFRRLDRKEVFAGVAAPQKAAVEKKTVDENKPAAPAPAPAPVPAPAPAAPAAAEGLIDISQFGTVQLRTAKIVVAERHPNADKLLRLEVDLGTERRQIVAGIASAYTPEQLLGRTVVVVANLKPAKLRGLESQGMLLAATGPDGVPHVLMPDGEVPPGAKVS